MKKCLFLCFSFVFASCASLDDRYLASEQNEKPIPGTSDTYSTGPIKKEMLVKGCMLDDVYYPEGTTYGDHICTNTDWVKGCMLNDVYYPEGTTYGDHICTNTDWVIMCNPARDLGCPTGSTRRSGGE